MRVKSRKISEKMGLGEVEEEYWRRYGN